MSFALLPSIFLQVCMPLVVVVGVGFFMDRRFKLSLESLVKLNLYVMVPAFIFARLLDTPMAGHEAGRVMATAFATLMLCGVVSFCVGRVLHLNGAAQKAHSLASMLGNCGNFGLPLVTLAFGKEAAAVQVYVLVTMNVSTFTVGLFLANADAFGGWRSHVKALSATLRQPAIYAVTAALICKNFDIPVQSVTFLWEPIKMLADALIGFALVTLGVQLSQTKPAPLRAPLISALAIRLLIGPVIAYGLTELMHFPKAVAAVIILTAGSPTAVNSALLAHEFGGDRSFATASVYYSTLLSMLTVTLNLAVLRWWMG
ncbi:MAG: Membrane transport protein [Verrucomicrobiaceae bacterium]|nr:Membrane transport protein [Verrucomicrobiaceae bacterium]